MEIRHAVLGLGLLGALAAAPCAQEQTAPLREAQILELIGQLGDDRYQARRDAETRLGEIGEPALEALKNAAENHDDEEVRWRARRLVQRIERGDVEGLRLRGAQDPRRIGGSIGPRTVPDLDRVFDRIFGDLEREFGLDIPRARFFEDDFFRGLEEQMGGLRRQLEDRMRGQAFGPGWNFDSSSQSVSVRIGPDGVRLEISKQNEQGETETDVYEAPDMESFREKYPEMAEQYLRGGGGLRGFALEPGWQGFHFTLPQTLRIAPRGGVVAPDVQRGPIQLEPRGRIAETPPPPEGRRLGVLVTDVPPEVGDWLGLDEGHGLLVQEVEEDGLAEALGIRAGDIVLQIGGRQIRGVEDVQSALGAIEAGERVEVTVNRRGQEVELQAEKRNSAEPPTLRDR